MESNLPLTRQNSVFSLTFDEFQNSCGGGIGKDFGSMNMDELLKNIWTAEESHSLMGNNASFNNGNNGNTVINSVNNNNNGGGLSVAVGGESGGLFTGGSLQRQGSLTLPRTISQRRVDDVWKELMKEEDIGNGGTSGIPQRQQTLGEMTLEDFLFRAGVVREEPQPVERLNNLYGGFYGFGSNGGLGTASHGFVANQPHDLSGNGAVVTHGIGANQPHNLSGNGAVVTHGFVASQPHDLSGNGAEVRPDLLTTQNQPLLVQQPQKVQQPQHLIQKQERPFPKQTTIAFSNTVDVDNRSQPAIQVTKNLRNYIFYNLDVVFMFYDKQFLDL